MFKYDLGSRTIYHNEFLTSYFVLFLFEKGPDKDEREKAANIALHARPSTQNFYSKSTVGAHKSIIPHPLLCLSSITIGNFENISKSRL